MDRPDLDTLWLRYRDGRDLKALGRLFDATAPELLGLATHLAPREAEDLLQATFVRALERASQHDAARGILPWLVGILANEARMLRRRQARPLDRALRDEPAAPDPAREAEQKELVTEVERALARMDEPYGPVLSLYLLHGLEAQEIAASLRRPAGTVRSQVTRGLELLRKALPAGLALGTAIVAVPCRGLAAVREAVLAHAAPATSALVGGGLLGATFMIKKGSAALAACALLGIGWWAWPEGGRPASEPAPRPLAADSGAATRPASPASREAWPAAAEPGTAATTPARVSSQLLVHTRWKRDGREARGIWCFALPVGIETTRIFKEMREACSGADGCARFENVQASKVEVTTERGGNAVVEMRSGSPTEVTLELDPDTDLGGTVVDALDRPVAGAEIWLLAGCQFQSGLCWFPAHPATTSDAQGTFALQGIHRWQILYAVADGHAPSRQARVEELTEPKKLVLHARGAEVRGRVRAGGRALAGASVSLSQFFRPEEGIDLWYQLQHMPGRLQHAVTDAAGRFALRDLPPFDFRLQAAHDGCVDAARSFRLAEGETRDLEIDLAAAWPLRGKVRGPDGKPVPGATVQAILGPYPAVRQTESDSAGEYVLNDLPIAPCGITCYAKGFEQFGLTSTPPATEPWSQDLVLEAAAHIRGRLVDPSGKPVTDIYVELVSPNWSTGGACDKDGRFDENVERGRLYSLWVRSTGSCIGVRALSGLEPGADVQLVITHALRPSAAVDLRLVDSDGKPMRDAGLSLEAGARRSRGVEEGTDAEGRLHIGPVPPGHYRVLLRGIGETLIGACVAEVDLGPGERKELGEVRVPTLREVSLQFRDSDGRLVSFSQGAIVDDDETVVTSFAVKRGRKVNLRLQAGSYGVDLGSTFLVSPSYRFTVPAEGPCSVSVPVARFIYRELQVELDPPPATRELLRVLDLGPNGELLRAPSWFRPPLSGAIPVSRFVVRGRNVVEVELESGRRYRGELMVEKLEPSVDTIRVRALEVR